MREGGREGKQEVIVAVVVGNVFSRVCVCFSVSARA